MAAFVLGNGISRRAIDPRDLERWGPVYGCNALYRTYSPLVLVATDAPISREIQASGWCRGRRFYTRRPLVDSGALPVPQAYYGFSSGPIAVAIAAGDRRDPIYLLGFDLGGDDWGRFNNVYAGTEFYKPQGSPPTFAGNWIRQIARVAQDFPDQRFIRVMGEVSTACPDLDRCPNFAHITMAEFLERINKAEEL